MGEAIAGMLVAKGADAILGNDGSSDPAPQGGQNGSIFGTSEIPKPSMVDMAGGGGLAPLNAGPGQQKLPKGGDKSTPGGGSLRM